VKGDEHGSIALLQSSIRGPHSPNCMHILIDAVRLGGSLVDQKRVERHQAMLLTRLKRDRMVWDHGLCHEPTRHEDGK
jgi:hypothetical protein